MSSTVLHESYRKKAVFFHGLSWRVNQITASWENWCSPIPSQFLVQNRNGEATVKHTDVAAQLS